MALANVDKHGDVNTIEPFMCGGDAAFLSNYVNQLFNMPAHFSDSSSACVRFLR